MSIRRSPVRHPDSRDPRSQEPPMRYLALIYAAEPDPGTMPPGAWEEMLASYDAFGRSAETAGVLRGGEALQSSDTATTIRVRDGQRLTTDGPFAETRE